MANINLNLSKTVSKWKGLITESLGVTDKSKIEWLAEYAEYHNIHENVAYAQGTNVTGMGAVVSPIASTTPGFLGTGTGLAGQSYGNGGVVGSGDYGQQLLPVAMKIAAHTIGLDLVPVKPTPGPVIDLIYVDHRYDDGATDGTDNYNPIVFKLSGLTTGGATALATLQTQIKTVLTSNNVKEIQGGLNKRVFFNFPINATITPNRPAGGVTNTLVEPATKTGVIEFLGFSRIDKAPMFKTYRTTNTTPQGRYNYQPTKNTFGELEYALDAFLETNGTVNPLEIATLEIGFGGLAVPLISSDLRIDLISALEDHIQGFVSNGKITGMSREEDDRNYGGIIAPNVTSKRVTVGTIEVTSALRLTEIEDIKSQTGIDIVSKIESVLVNELSQHISKEIVNKLFAMGDLNRASTPGYVTPSSTTIFDYDVDAYLSTGGGTSFSPGGETKASLQNGLMTKIQMASNYLITEGRVGPGTFIVTNGTLAAVLQRGANYELNKEPYTSTSQGQLYPAGKFMNMTVYVDPYMSYSDSRILIGRKNAIDQPGVVFVPYLMAQSVKIISEATFAPRLMLRSRYTVSELGFFPEKQYLTINVKDTYNRLA